jgi:DNA-binding Lrp family transcriptional regulator
MILRVQCEVGQLPEVATSLAHRPESLWVYGVSGPNEVVAEAFCPTERAASFLYEELASLTGVADYTASPVLRYFRVMDEWRPGILSDDQAAELRTASSKPAIDQFGDQLELAPDERIIVGALSTDGRLTHEDLAAMADVSKATARRRTDVLRDNGVITIRAVIEPALLGFPVEAVLSIEAEPQHVESLGTALADLSCVRYAWAVAGERQIIAQVAVPTKADLYSLLTSPSPWLPEVRSIATSVVVHVYKRSDVITTPILREQLAGA